MSFTNWYIGMDTNSNTPFPCAGSGKNFYIGRLGGETTSGGGGFDTATAETVGPTVTSSFWDISGPVNAPAEPYTWGTEQANAFYNAWISDIYVNGSTLFGDLEPGNYPGSWGSNQTDNQNVVYGFLNKLKSLGVTPGLYVSTSNWDTYLGPTYASPVPFVFWLAGTDCPTSCSAAETEFNNSTTDITRGGYRVMIWQYVIAYDPTTGGGCKNETKDYDITPYSGYLTGHWNPTT